MSQTNGLNVDLYALQAMISQLAGLSASLGDVAAQLQDSSDLSWTGADDNGVTLYEALDPAEQASIRAITDAKGVIDGLIDSLGRTGGLWNSTEGTNFALNG